MMVNFLFPEWASAREDAFFYNSPNGILPAYPVHG